MILLRQALHQYDSKTKVPLPSLNLEQGEDLLISGRSGSGKSTLLHVLAGLLRPSRGSLTIQDTDLYSLKESKRDRFRGKHIGIVLQQIHLMDSDSAIELNGVKLTEAQFNTYTYNGIYEPRRRDFNKTTRIY